MTRADIPDPRARLYLLLAVPFEFPDRKRGDKFIHGSWARAVRALCETLDLPLDCPLNLDVTFNEFEVEFIKLFEVGLGGAPCPLHSGYYARDRMKDLEEVVRFYQFFDFHAPRTPDRFPDHLVFEMQFMAHLIQREDTGADRKNSLILAQRDFLQRHLATWIAPLRKSIEIRAEIPFIRGVAGLLDEFIKEEQDRLCKEVQQEVQSA